jgi:putative nucleotidyltransferase with HDIG domain
LNYFGGASVAAHLVVYTRQFDWTFLGVTIPLLLVLYMTFRTSMARVADATTHLEELNALYLATVQTLAAAIDAKDQVTHGHIRRVQNYAVALAKAVGVKDELQVRAIQAAAVLHDTGKIAVPEAILNKPGPLDPDEFAIMKQHAAVGADIISSIRFPYPVEPIVRHHHENWDGTGYPEGLRGTEIPIGARILAVVDCFDALTSDRPYRKRMSDADALAIVSERRGRMYDPLIVDSFLRIYSALRIEEPRAEEFPALSSDASPSFSAGATARP